MGWGGVVVAHKILLSAPVPWIGDLGLGDWGLGLDNFLGSVRKGEIKQLKSFFASYLLNQTKGLVL